MSPLFTQPPPIILLERKLGGGYRIVLFPETVHAVYMHLTEEQYEELRKQMAMLDNDAETTKQAAPS